MTDCIRGKVKLSTPAVDSISSCLVRTVRGHTKDVIDEDGKSHPLLSLNGREHLGRVLERNRSLTQRITDGEEVDETNESHQCLVSHRPGVKDEQCDRSKLGTRAPIFLQERETRRQQEDAHEGERLGAHRQRVASTTGQSMHTYDECERPPSLCVDQEDSRDRGDKLKRAVAEGGIESLYRCETDLEEDGGTVEGDDCEKLAMSNSGDLNSSSLLMPHI